MDKRTVRSIGRMGTYIAVAAVAYAVLMLVRLWQGSVPGPTATLHVLVALTVALCVGMPAGLAFAMAKE